MNTENLVSIHLPVQYWIGLYGKNNNINKNKQLRGLSPQVNYTDRVTTACRRNYCQLLRIVGVAWSAQRIPTAVFSVF
jgi:hypothetical protein